MVNEIDPIAWARIYDVALSAAKGDERTALAMLLGCYVEMASRLVKLGIELNLPSRPLSLLNGRAPSSRDPSRRSPGSSKSGERRGSSGVAGTGLLGEMLTR